jgi:hypothetical protein
MEAVKNVLSDFLIILKQAFVQKLVIYVQLGINVLENVLRVT